MDHAAPPPPYSETDIYSNATTSPPVILTPSTSHADDASVAARTVPSAASSSVDDSVVYTPPYSPTSSLHHGLGGDGDHVVTSSAAAYFESRPSRGDFQGTPTTHSIRVSSTTEPKDLPFPEPRLDWLAKGITNQDWATFVNYLLPDHMTTVNNDVADRKLKAELIDERMHRLTLNQEDRSRIDIMQVDAQLNPLRQLASPQRTESMGMIEATIAEWNEGFFCPRGLRIELIDTGLPGEDYSQRMPGAFIQDDPELLQDSSRIHRGARRSLFERFNQAPGVGSNGRGFRFGPIVADNQGFRIGRNGLVADSNGFRMGDMLVANHNGFRLGGTRGFVADRQGIRVGGIAAQDIREHGRDWGHRGRHHHRSRSRSRGRRGRRGQHGRQHGRQRGRSVSSSSSSSSSDSDSSDSDSSLGSLPNGDILKDHQLPTAKQSLLEWLNHPEHPMTAEVVDNMRRDIRAAKTPKGPYEKSKEDMTALRKEVKDLLKEFKDGKKAYKNRRRREKRERRAAKRAQKRERRLAKKEERKLRQDMKNRKSIDNGGETPFGTSQNCPISTYANPIASSKLPMLPLPRGMTPWAEGGPNPIPPGTSAMPGGWPVNHGVPYVPGRAYAPHYTGLPVSQSHSVLQQIYVQAQQMEAEAAMKIAQAVRMRTAATRHGVGEKQRLKMAGQATALEEEAEISRREAEISRREAEISRREAELRAESSRIAAGRRLDAEALHGDGQLAQELDKGGESGQASGVIPR